MIDSLVKFLYTNTEVPKPDTNNRIFIARCLHDKDSININTFDIQ